VVRGDKWGEKKYLITDNQPVHYEGTTARFGGEPLTNQCDNSIAQAKETGKRKNRFKENLSQKKVK